MVKAKLIGHTFMLLDFPRRPKSSQETGRTLCNFVSLVVEGLREPKEIWSGRRDLNPRLRPWQGRTLPLSYSRSAASIINKASHRGNGGHIPMTLKSTLRALRPQEDRKSAISPLLVNLRTGTSGP
jgi:hypothetical protein